MATNPKPPRSGADVVPVNLVTYFDKEGRSHTTSEPFTVEQQAEYDARNAQAVQDTARADRIAQRLQAARQAAYGTQGTPGPLRRLMRGEALTVAELNVAMRGVCAELLAGRVEDPGA